MAKYFLTNKAITDLSEIWDYTFETQSEKQADNYYYDLLEDCKALSENQELGRIYNEISDEILGYKSGQHIIFYRKISKNEIEITRFSHARMDLKNRISE